MQILPRHGRAQGVQLHGRHPPGQVSGGYSGGRSAKPRRRVPQHDPGGWHLFGEGQPNTAEPAHRSTTRGSAAVSATWRPRPVPRCRAVGSARFRDIQRQAVKLPLADQDKPPAPRPDGARARRRPCCSTDSGTYSEPSGSRAARVFPAAKHTSSRDSSVGSGRPAAGILPHVKSRLLYVIAIIRTVFTSSVFFGALR